MSPILRAPALWITAALALATLGDALARDAAARRKREAAGIHAQAGAENLAVTLTVAPEQFHMSRLQQWGTMVGAEGRTVRLRNVAPAAAASIARESWVAGLQRLDR